VYRIYVHLKNGVNADAIIIVLRRPIDLFNIPPIMENNAAVATVTVTTSSCSIVCKSNFSLRSSIAPETTPVSYPNKKPPIAEKSVNLYKKLWLSLTQVYILRGNRMLKINNKIKLETCFPFLIHCWPIRARVVSHYKITKNRKNVISPILQEIF